jgi:broad specificity phosphatase PhoE
MTNTPMHPRCTLPGARLLLALLCLLAFVGRSEAGLKIYYLRHAEAGHNVVKQWANVPKEQRPAYVGNGNMFTPKGEAQAEAVVKKLQPYRFDAIAVSPMWRTRHTILPYLKAAGAKAEIWPELHEFSGIANVLATNLPAPSGPVLGAGPRVEVPAEEATCFTVREDGKNNFKLPAKKGEETQAALQVVTQHTVKLLRQRYGSSEKTILLVGHGNTGIALLKLLIHDPLPNTPSMTNTSLWMVEEQPDGQFKLKLYNDAPCEQSQPVAAKQATG